MHINALPKDCLFLIFRKIEICRFEDGHVSYMGRLALCGWCYNREIPKCHHLHEMEDWGIKFLRLVCKRWNETILQRFRFSY